MSANKKFCRKCHKKRAITNRANGWCRACAEKINAQYCFVKVLPHPPRYDDILAMARDGIFTQREIAKRVGRSLTNVQNVIARYTVKVDAAGCERP